VFIGLTAEAIAALAGASLTQTQAEDAASTVFGQVSGQRLAQAAAALVWPYAPANTAFATGVTAFSHGLGRHPHDFKVTLVCRVAIHGYSIGDEIEMSTVSEGVSGIIYGSQVIADTTNITVVAGSTLYRHKNAVTAGNVSNGTNWDFKVRAR